MGIGSTMKNMLGTENPTGEHEEDTLTNESSHLTNSNRAARLPSGTGPGTSGKGGTAASHGSGFARPSDARPLDSDAAKTVQDISGFGTDASAAVGGSLSASHQATGDAHDRRSNNARTHQGTGASSHDRTGHADFQPPREVSTTASASGPTPVTSSKRASQAARENINNLKGESVTSGIQPTTNLTSVSESSEIGNYGDGNVRIIHEREVNEREYDVPREGRELNRRTESFSGNHQFGHNKATSKDSMPTPNAEEDTNQLQPVTHERIRHIETEEVSRIKELDRHIHHIQFHTQPIVASEELAEQIREQMVPVTTINEIHTNKAEDNTLFEGQVHQYHDTLIHSAKERTVIDKGTTVKEHVHHHVHHVIQPVIEKETIDKQVIHTTIPIHEITHEAPVVHQSQTHAPVPLEHFLSRGGTLRGAISQDAIAKKVLRSGQCSREVDGVAETLERDLRLKGTNVRHGTRKVLETDEQIRTTVAPVGQN